MTRRTTVFALLAVLAGPASADSRTDALDIVTPLAAALSEGDAGGFVRAIPKEAPNYDELCRNVRALVAQAVVTSSVDVLKAEPGAAELDWYTEIRSRATDTIVERRREVIRIRFDRGRLKSIGPAGFFAPPKVAP